MIRPHILTGHKGVTEVGWNFFHLDRCEINLSKPKYDLNGKDISIVCFQLKQPPSSN